MSVDDKLMDRLRKLSELAERGEDGEAENAAARLAELMAKHNLSTIDLSGLDGRVVLDEGRVDAEEGQPLSRVENWDKTLFGAICDVMGARGWIRGSGKLFEFRMVGPRDSVSAARYMYLWLRRQIADTSRGATRRAGESNAWRRSFALGMVARVHTRMSEARRTVYAAATSTALVLVDRQKEAIDARMSEMKLRDVRAKPRKRPDAGSYGWAAGADVDLGDVEAAKLGEGHKKLTGGQG